MPKSVAECFPVWKDPVGTLFMSGAFFFYKSLIIKMLTETSRYAPKHLFKLKFSVGVWVAFLGSAVEKSPAWALFYER